jgi:hypothetical protein
MRPFISKSKMVNSLCALANKLTMNSLPSDLLGEVLIQNPWYTPYYIKRSLDGIRTWLAEDTLTQFLANYPHRPQKALPVGIITAGNLPLVGFHDVLMGALSGHHILIRSSHQDRLLMQWVLDQWTSISPEIQDQIQMVPELPKVDFLLATGSNNTARYLKKKYGHQRHLIRQNRFSVAVLDSDIDEVKMRRLADDVLLYNGLGCRNVSSFIINSGFPLTPWKEVLSSYAKERLNARYLEQLLREKTRLKMLGASYIDGDILLMRTQDSLRHPSMGVLNLVKVSGEREINDLLEANANRIQCVVGRDTAFGMTQQPRIGDFADGVDTLAMLTCLN